MIRRRVCFTGLTLSALAIAIGAAGLATSPASAALDTGCTGFDCVTNDSNTREIAEETGASGSVESLATTITNAFIYLIAGIAVIMLVYGGIRYSISSGDKNATTNAKNIILYAVVGLVVALLGYALVNFVLGSV